LCISAQPDRSNNVASISIKCAAGGLASPSGLVMVAYTFLMLQSLEHEVQTDPAPEVAFPPCAATQSSGLPSTGARSALPGCGLMAH
jgi:hypothetical protein